MAGKARGSSAEERRNAALARAVRLVAESGASFEQLLSRSPVLERRLVDIALGRVDGAPAETQARAVPTVRPVEGVPASAPGRVRRRRRAGGADDPAPA